MGYIFCHIGFFFVGYLDDEMMDIYLDDLWRRILGKILLIASAVSMCVFVVICHDFDLKLCILRYQSEIVI